MSDSDKDKNQKPTGQVRHDPGGRAVWQWAVESGRHAIESTSLLLKKLDLSHLRILEDDEKSAERNPDTPKDLPTFGSDREKDPLAQKRQSFDPYNSRTPTGRGTAPPKPQAPPRPRVTQPALPTKKPGFVARMFGKK